MKHLKKEGDTMEQNKKRLCIISLFIMGLFFCIGSETVNAKTKVVTPKRIRRIYQNVEYKYEDKNGNTVRRTENEPISCGIETCNQHSSEHIVEGIKKGIHAKEYVKCNSGSNLYMIKIPLNTIRNKKVEKEYKTLKELKFYSMQGSCCKGNDIYIAFSDKGRSGKVNDIKKSTGIEELNLTAIVKLKLEGKDYKVAQVAVIKGFENMDDSINYMGHANDMTYCNKKLQTTWYEVKGKKGKKRFTLGYIDISDTVKGMATNIGNDADSKKKSVFGVAKYKNRDNELAVGIREKGKNVKRYVDVYKCVKKDNTGIKYRYVRKKRLFDIKASKINKQKYSITQCMESSGNYIFVNQFYEKNKGNNNCIQIYKNNKHKKNIVIRDPGIRMPGQEKETSLSNKRWEMEGFGKIKGDTYYCLMAMPLTDKKDGINNDKKVTLKTKQAYLCTMKIKK